MRSKNGEWEERMKAVVLVDNISQGDISGEWGLSIYI